MLHSNNFVASALRPDMLSPHEDQDSKEQHQESETSRVSRQDEDPRGKADDSRTPPTRPGPSVAINQKTHSTPTPSGSGRFRIWLCLAVLTALALRLVTLPLAEIIEPFGDAKGYLYFAQEWADGQHLAQLPSGVRPPLHRMLIAPGLDRDTEPLDPFPGVYAIHIACDMATLLLLAGIARRRYGEKVGMATAWLHALFPCAVLWSSTVVMVESPALLFAALALDRWERLDRALAQPGARSWAIAGSWGIVLGLGILTKETLLAVGVALFAAILFRHRAPLKRRLGILAVAVTMVFLVTTPWRLYTQQNYGISLISGTYGSYGLMVDNGPPEADTGATWINEKDLSQRVDRARSIFWRALTTRTAQTMNRAIDRLRVLAGPEVTLPTSFAVAFDGHAPLEAGHKRGIWKMSWSFPLDQWSGQIQTLCNIGTLLLLSLAVAGWTARRKDSLAVVASFLITLTVITVALTVAEARYRLIWWPFLAPLAGWAVVQLFEKGWTRRSTIAFSLAALFLTTTMYLLPPP